MGFLGCKEAVFQLKVAIKNCSKFHDWPIRMDDRTGRVYLDKSWKTRLCWATQCCLWLLKLVFMVFRLIEALHSDVVVVSKIIFIQILIVMYLIPFYINAAFLFNGDHIVSVLNLAVPFFQAYEVSNAQGKLQEGRKSLAWLVKALQFSMMANASLYFVVMLVRLEAKESILSALPESVGQTWLMRCLVVLLYAFLSRSVAMGTGFLSVHMLTISLWTTRTLKDLRVRIQSADWDVATLHDTLKAHTQLCIITREFSQSVAIMLPMTKLVIIIPAIFATYAVIKLEGVVAMFCAVYAVDTTAGMELGLSIFADVHCESDAYLKCVRGRVVRKGPLGKQVKAAGRAAVEVGGQMYFVDKTLMLTVLHIIVSNSVSFMLAF